LIEVYPVTAPLRRSAGKALPDKPKHPDCMINPLCRLAWIRRTLASLLVIPLLALALRGQTSGTGTITGRVFDEGSGRALQGAVVTVRGTNHSDFTDTEGRFSITGVPAGAANLDIEYVGLDRQTQQVNVAAGTVANVDTRLRSSVLQLAAFEVKEAARGQALAINQQKTAAGIVNIVSEETFGQMVGGNPGYALQRLPGISVDEDQDGTPTEVNLRGVPGDFNSVQMDGNRLPSAGGTSRAASMRNLVADGITNIEVIKAATPDRDGDAIGGIINVVSRTAFQRDGREVRIVGSASYNDLFGNWGYNGRVSFSDIYGILGREKNLGISITATKYRTDRYSENADIDWERVTPALFPQLNLPAPTKFLEASHYERSFRSTFSHGVSGSIDFRTDNHNSWYLRPGWSHYDANSRTYETDWDIDKRFQDVAGGRKTYAFLSPDGSRGGGTPGATGSQASLGYIGTDNDEHNDLWTWAAGGKHELASSTFNYDFFYSTSTYVRPNFTEFNVVNQPAAQGYYIMEYDATNRLRPQYKITNGLSPTDFAYTRQGPVNLIFIPRSKEEEIYSAKADYEKKLGGDTISQSIKFGGKYRSSKLRYDQESVSYQIAANAPAQANFPFSRVLIPTNDTLWGNPRFQYADQKEAAKIYFENPGIWTAVQPGSFNNSNSADYTGKEESKAGYVMDTLKMGRHSVIAGVRWEETEFSRTGRRTIVRPGNVFTTEPVSSGAKYDMWLPGIHFRHALAPNLILRESFNKSYGRPKFSDITRGRAETVAVTGALSITEGNPDLQPMESNNFDIQLEWYNDKGGLYSVALFQKDIKNFAFSQITRFDVFDANNRPVPVASGFNTHTQPQNGPGAKNRGIELIARQRLSFLPGAFKGFSVDLSATFTKSRATVPGREADDIPLEGFSKYLFTSSLSYNWNRFGARVDYRYRDAYIEGLEADTDGDEWFSAREQVDAEITFRIRKGLNFFASGANLTHRPQVSYTGQKVFPEDISYSGRKFVAGLEYRF
jgi:TonB-dependent receptor